MDLNNISSDQAIFTENFIYRKIDNLNNKNDVYVLTRLNNKFVWDKTDDHLDMNNSKITLQNFSDLRCINKDNKSLTVYLVYENIVTHYIENAVNNLLWHSFNTPIDINELPVMSLLDIPSHIDLTREGEFNEGEFNEGEFNEGVPFDINFEPLCGWDNLLERDDPKDTNLDNMNKLY